jgi:hypothetical protein
MTSDFIPCVIDIHACPDSANPLSQVLFRAKVDHLLGLTAKLLREIRLPWTQTVTTVS